MSELGIEKIETAEAMCADAWFQVCLRRRNNLPCDVALARFEGMTKMLDHCLPMPYMWVDTVKEQGAKIFQDLEARNGVELSDLPPAVAHELLREG